MPTTEQLLIALVLVKTCKLLSIYSDKLNLETRSSTYNVDDYKMNAKQGYKIAQNLKLKLIKGEKQHLNL